MTVERGFLMNNPGKAWVWLKVLPALVLLVQVSPSEAKAKPKRHDLTVNVISPPRGSQKFTASGVFKVPPDVDAIALASGTRTVRGA
ncbi:MAG: hypothetical protein AAB576_07160, partial [Elusimicrobiota bacterium]